jgi:hypothetical protein
MDIKRRLASQSAIIFGARLFGAGLIFSGPGGDRPGVGVGDPR